MPDNLVHAQTTAEVFQQLQSAAAGLSEQDADRRLQQFGPNRLDPVKPVSALAILLDQLRSVVVLLLVAAAAVSFTLGERVEAAAIAAVLVINAAIGFLTELRARSAMAALLRLDVPRAIVIRSGQALAMDAHLIVPGDVIQLDVGQGVPADGRVVEDTDLQMNEAALTGESMPVAKSSEPVPADTPLADRRNMVYKGTTVSVGTGRAVVTATGAATELGRVGRLVTTVRADRTPLERRLDDLGHRLVWLALAVAALVAALGAIQGAPPALMFETGIALAVAAVPEALPAVATIALAVGVHRMARRRALIRRLPAVEALGSTTVVCTDKTRTLTSGDMTVVRIWAGGRDFDVPGQQQPPVDPLLHRALEAAALASRSQVHRAEDGETEVDNPVDAAILKAADRIGADRTRLVQERPLEGIIPFSSQRKLMAAFHRVGGDLVVYVKGAPGQILALSDRDWSGAPLDDERRKAIREVNERFAAGGLRVLAVACGPVSEPSETALAKLAFVGFIGLMDPPAPGVRETIARLRDAGLRTVMLTGDQRLTAAAVGRELGLLSEASEVLEGREMDALSPQQLAARVSAIGAFSRISPEHKLAIVSALQARGEIVAMLGDGVNDAPALRKADVGVAMGQRGTDVAKEAAAIVLQDDRFETIAAAVEEGRIIFDNIQKFVFYLFSCNLGEILVLLVAGLGGWPLPLLPLQLLWLNMVTDTFPALALAMEPGDPDVMRRPPRDPQAAILSRRFLGEVLLYGGLITLSGLAAFLWCLRHDPDRAQTVAFMTLALAQTFHLGNARSAEAVLRPARAAANPYALAAVAASVGLQMAALHVEPLAQVLRVVPLGRDHWVTVVLCSAVPVVAGQGLKIWRAWARAGGT